MNRCPACDYVVPPVWDTCRNCGAELKASVGAATVSAAFVDLATGPPAAPAPPAAAAATAPNGGAPSWSASTLPEPQHFDLLPSATAGRAPGRAGRPSALLAAGAGLGVLAVVGALVAFFA